jgi:predicted enzyme related to lactoylglutathione lyase
MAAKASRKSAKRAVRSGKPAKKSSKASRSRPSHTPAKGLHGWITHTELASTDPAATKAWCQKALGWRFKPALPMPDGAYHLFTYSEQGGGGIRATRPAEAPGSTPTVHVADAHAAFAKAVREGAEPVTPPMRVMEGVTIALVKAPGGVLIGLSGP